MAAPADSPIRGGAPRGAGFRFYDNRQKYLLFVNTCSEKWVVAERVGMELAQIRPKPPALRVFDAGVGAGTVLANSAYLEATREVLQKHGGLWFLDESYVVSRRRP